MGYDPIVEAIGARVRRFGRAAQGTAPHAPHAICPVGGGARGRPGRGHAQLRPRNRQRRRGEGP
eukprot:9439229-Lingulodinium_polyedra.AAC.1